MQVFLLVLCIIGILFIIGSLIVLNKSKFSNLQKLTDYIGYSVLFSLLGYIIELRYTDIGALTLAVRVEWFAASLFVVSLAAFSISYCQIKMPKSIKFIFVFYAFVSGVVNLILINIPQYIVNPTLSVHGIYQRAIYSIGYFKYADIVLSSVIGLLAFYIALIFRKRNKEVVLDGIVNVAILNIIPVLGNVLFLVLSSKCYSVVPFFLFIAWVILFISVFKFRMFDSMQMAKDDILDTVEDGYIVVDQTDSIVYINEKARQIFPELKFEATHSVVLEKLKKFDKDDMVVGENRYHISIVPLMDKNTLKGSTIWLNDITEEYNSTKRLIELKEEAEEANRAKSVFLANMSHEIRTPMNAIIGMTEMILHDNINSKVEENAKNIRSASNSLLTIINGILDFSKIENGKMEMSEVDYNLGYILKDISKMIILKLHNKNVELIVHVKETIPSGLKGDETHVRQIFTNILTNAVKYTKRGYIRMNVDWEPVMHEGHEMALIKVSIEDTGCGIKEESIPTLFDSFQRADMIKNRTIEGTGLGLAICKRLVESMNGDISVKSTYGVGSVFSFHILQKIENREYIGNYDELELPGDNEFEKTFIAPLAKILVVDDNLTNLKVAQGILTMYQVRVDTATSGKECLEKIEKNNYHMIFMDQMMPEMDGIETTKLIRLHSKPDIRNMIIIAVTANAISGTREMFLQSGFQEYISKPINISNIESILKRFLPPEVIHYIERKKNDTDYSDVEIIIPDVNVDQGLINYGNDKAKYLQILKFIYDDGTQHLNRIKDYYEGQHYREYVFEVHALKGLMAGIGANKLAEFARILEFAGRDGNLEVIERESEFLLQQYHEMLLNIKEVLNDTGMLREEISTIREEELTWKEFCDMLHSLQGSLDLLEQGEAARKTDNLLTYPFDAGIRKQLIEIKHAINEFEYDNASEIIKLLLS